MTDAPVTTPEAAAMASVAAAVTGPGTPDAAHVRAEPPKYAVWALILAGPALSAGIIAMGLVVVVKFWPDLVTLRAIEILGRVIWGWFGVMCALVGALCLVIFRLAAGGLKKVDARAGPAGLTIETDG